MMKLLFASILTLPLIGCGVAGVQCEVNDQTASFSNCCEAQRAYANFVPGEYGTDDTESASQAVSELRQYVNAQCGPVGRECGCPP